MIVERNKKKAHKRTGQREEDRTKGMTRNSLKHIKERERDNNTHHESVLVCPVFFRFVRSFCVRTLIMFNDGPLLMPADPV